MNNFFTTIKELVIGIFWNKGYESSFSHHSSDTHQKPEPNEG